MAERLYISHEKEASDLALVLVCIHADLSEHLRGLLDARTWESQICAFDRYLSAERRPALGAAIRSAARCVAFIDFDLDPEQAALTAQYLQSVLGGELTLVAVAEKASQTVMLQAMRAGCKEFLNAPVSDEALLQVLDRLSQRVPDTQRFSKSAGSVISFFGTKGGAGTTTLAVHLSTFLAAAHKKRVLLIDHHAELGHVCVYLGLDGTRVHFQEVVRNVTRLDSELLGGFIAHHASGLDVLSSPDICGTSKPLDREAIAHTIEFLRNEYDYVILDCGVLAADRDASLIELSTMIYLVALPQVGAIRDLSRYIDVLSPAENPGDRLKVIINHATAPAAIAVSQIEKAIKLPITLRFASSPTEFVPAANLGAPLLPETKSELVTALLKWSTGVAGSAPVFDRKPVNGNRSMFGMFKQSAVPRANEVKAA